MPQYIYSFSQYNLGYIGYNVNQLTFLLLKLTVSGLI